MNNVMSAYCKWCGGVLQLEEIKERQECVKCGVCGLSYSREIEYPLKEEV